MATTAREAYGQICMMVLVNSSGSQWDTCLPGQCSAWEWDTSEADGDDRRGHCLLAGGKVAPQGDRKPALEMH